MDVAQDFVNMVMTLLAFLYQLHVHHEATYHLNGIGRFTGMKIKEKTVVSIC
jgi:hypothetical protein